MPEKRDPFWKTTNVKPNNAFLQPHLRCRCFIHWYPVLIYWKPPHQFGQPRSPCIVRCVLRCSFWPAKAKIWMIDYDRLVHCLNMKHLLHYQGSCLETGRSLGHRFLVLWKPNRGEATCDNSWSISLLGKVWEVKWSKKGWQMVRAYLFLKCLDLFQKVHRYSKQPSLADLDCKGCLDHPTDAESRST